MLLKLLLGCVIVFISMGIQVMVVVQMLRYFFRVMHHKQRKKVRTLFDSYVLGMILLMLFAGHLFQVAIWAVVFVYIGEFVDFMTAFYHSAVNFSSLGYGDIVMSEDWRLLGSLEAINGVLMFGLSAGTMFALMAEMFKDKPAYSAE